MPIKLKLLLSYIAMLIVPVILTAVAALLIAFAYLGAGTNRTDIKQNIFKNAFEESSKRFEGIKSTASSSPDIFENPQYLSELDSNLQAINSSIIVLKQGRIIYSTKSLDAARIIGALTEHRPLGDINHDQVQINVDHKNYTVRNFNFYFTDKSAGSIYMLIDISPIREFFQKYFFTLMIAVLLILLFTNIALTYIMSKNITKPLDILKTATNEIKNGNLNFEVNINSKDEFAELGSAFEDMRRKLKESIETQLQYEDDRKELISSISHDLKTPITAIKGYVEGIMDGVADSPEKMEKYIKTIHGKACDIDKLIEELFLYSKLDLRKLPFNFEKTDINRYLSYCVEELSFDLGRKGIQLQSHIDISTPNFVVADGEKLKRVIINIIENSTKYMNKEKGEIIIAAEDSGPFVTVGIKDNGCGINSEDLPYIFERFYRGDPSRNTSTGGSGLGLAIAKRIIEEHGGKIWAESKPGVGTEIYFTLKKFTETYNL